MMHFQTRFAVAGNASSAVSGDDFVAQFSPLLRFRQRQFQPFRRHINAYYKIFRFCENAKKSRRNFLLKKLTHSSDLWYNFFRCLTSTMEA